MDIEQEYSITQTHNIFLNKLIDNQQPKQVHFMKLDSHRTLYRNGIQYKYLNNLIVSGRNFIEPYAIFQNQITLSMGSHQIFEDIRIVRQWEKNIVIQAGNNKIIGLYYEDSIIKNSFMISLQFLELGPHQKIDIVCDKFGYYMLIVTARELLLCVSQKSIQKNKAKPFYHRHSTIVSEDIKWNRPDYQSVVDVIRIQLYDFDISKVECFNFCDDKLYFIGHSSKNSTEKHFFYIDCSIIFEDNQLKPLLMALNQQPSTVKQRYPIFRGMQTQYLVVNKDGSIELQSQNRNLIIEKNRFQSVVNQDNPLIKYTPQTIFPFYVLSGDILYVYRRDSGYGDNSITIASQIYRTQVKLPQQVYVSQFDIKQHVFAYCNVCEVVIFNFQSFEEQVTNMPKKGQNKDKDNIPYKNILKQSFGSIVDFNLGKNFMIIQNLYQNKCRLNLLSKAIKEDPRSFVTHPRKNGLEALPKTKSIRSLSQFIPQLYLQSENKLVYQTISQLYVVKNNERKNYLYKLDQLGKIEIIESQFEYYTVINKKYLEYTQEVIWVIVLIYQNNKIKYLQIVPNKIPQLLKEVQSENLKINFEKGTHKIYNFNQFLLQVQNNDNFVINFYNMRQNLSFEKQLAKESIRHQCGVKILRKNITFKKKDKDYFIIQVLAINQKNQFCIWELSVSTNQSKLTHKTQDIGQGLPILFHQPHHSKSIIPSTPSHRLRALTCPQYIVQSQSASSNFYKSPQIIKMKTYEYQGQSFLLLINSNHSLLLYKKYYCSHSATNLQAVGLGHNLVNPQIMHSDIGFLYHRIPIQLSVLKKWEYNEKKAFVQLGQGILRVCNYAFYKNQFFQIPDETISCFRMDDEIWGLQSTGKIRMLVTKGKIISHFLVSTIDTSLKQNLLGIDATNQIYAIYSPKGFQIMNKDPSIIWKSNPNQFNNNERIISLCAFQHYFAVSYYNYAANQQNKDEYQSIKFKLRIYNSILRNKIIEKQMPLEEPALFIEYIAPDKLLLVTPSNVFVYLVKNDRTLQSLRRKNYSKRNMLSSFSYIPQKHGIEPGYMIFGGNYGGLSFMVGQWIQREKLDQIWFDNIKCSIKELQIFHYGSKNDFLKTLVADDQGNLIILDLTPKKTQKLHDIHIGSNVLKMKKRNQIPYVSSQDGCINLVIPIRLKNIGVSFLDFQEQLTQEIPFLGGLNTRDTRNLDQSYRTYKITSSGNVVDSQIFKYFMCLTQSLQNHLFDKIDMDMKDLKQHLLKDI